MLIGVERGGTKIEAAALEEDALYCSGAGRTHDRTMRDACVSWRTWWRLSSGLRRDGSGRVGCSVRAIRGWAWRRGAPSTGLSGCRVEDGLRTALGRDPRTANDADCLAAWEAADGAGEGHRLVFAETLGSGARPVSSSTGPHGPNNGAGEWGHNPLPLPDVTETPRAACYRRGHGCLESGCLAGRSFVSTRSMPGPTNPVITSS
jgi:fructokinase